MISKGEGRARNQVPGAAGGHGTYAAGLLNAFAGEPETSFHLYLPRAPLRREWPANVSIHVPASPPRGMAALAVWELVGAPEDARRRRRRPDPLPTARPGGWEPRVAGSHGHAFDTIEWTVPGYARSLPERVLQRRQLRGASRVIVPSPEVADAVRIASSMWTDRSSRSFHSRGRRCRREQASGSLDSQLEDPYLLFVGGSERRKNLPALLESHSRRRRPGR